MKCRMMQHGLKLFGLGAMAGLSACQSLKPDKLSNEDLAREFYEVQIQTLETLDQSFLRLSQEYYTMSVEYKKMNQAELGQLTLQKAEMFQKQHQEFEKRVADLQVRRARALRGEQPEMREEPETPAMVAPAKAPSKKGVIQTKPKMKAPKPSPSAAPVPASAPTPALAPDPAPEAPMSAPEPAPAAEPAAPPQAPPPPTEAQAVPPQGQELPQTPLPTNPQ